MKHFKDGNTEIPYENSHFDDEERENEPTIKHFYLEEDDALYDGGTIKHFQD